SGVIIDSGGVALTNAHVIERATEIEIITLDGSKHKAKVVGLDKKTDLAVLRLDDGKGKFPSIRLGDSDKMQVGDWVIAVGSPFGLQATVTAGIISAKARQIGQGPFDDFLQTDAAINPGNSGRPLGKMEGPADLQRAVGLANPGNSAKVKVWRDQGEKSVEVKIGEAPEEREAKGPNGQRGTKSALGMDVRPITPDVARQLNLRSTDGVVVARVDDGSAAAEAGIQRGDVIREINRQKVRSQSDFDRLTKDVKEGDRLTLLLQRGTM